MPASSAVCTRFVPARTSMRAKIGYRTCQFAGIFLKPSEGLEPSTPSLPWKFWRGNGVHARSSATPFLLLIRSSVVPRPCRETSRVSFLMCPFCVRRMLQNVTTHPVHVADAARRCWPPRALARRSRAPPRNLLSSRGRCSRSSAPTHAPSDPTDQRQAVPPQTSLRPPHMGRAFNLEERPGGFSRRREGRCRKSSARRTPRAACE
jgi:hypothetical protein